ENRRTATATGIGDIARESGRESGTLLGNQGHASILARPSRGRDHTFGRPLHGSGREAFPPTALRLGPTRPSEDGASPFCRSDPSNRAPRSRPGQRHQLSPRATPSLPRSPPPSSTPASRP